MRNFGIWHGTHVTSSPPERSHCCNGLGSKRTSALSRNQPDPRAWPRRWRQLEASIGGDVRRLHYLSIPPIAAADTIEMLGKADLVERSRVIMEKPFGVDLASAKALNETVHRIFDEEQVFRN